MIRIVCCLLLLCCTAAVQAEVVHREKSLYRDMYVEELDGQRCLKFRTRGARESNQSCIFLERPEVLALRYTRMAMAGLFIQPQPKNILVLGLGGGILPRALRSLYPEAEITSVEIDAAVVAVARKFFHYQDDKNSRVVTQDARVFVKRAKIKKAQYDYIVLDAFNGDYIPGHLMTLEFFQEIHKIMSPNALLVANTFSRSELVHHESATYQEAFGQFYTVQESGSGNRIVLASNAPLPSRSQMRQQVNILDPIMRPLGINPRKLFANLTRWPKWKRSAKVLTDQYAPVNVLNGQ